MKFYRYQMGLVFGVVLQRILMPRSVFNKLAVSSLLISAAAFSTPWWESMVEAVTAYLGLESSASPLPPIAGGVLFLLLTFVFAALSHRAQSKQTPEPLVDTPVTSPTIRIERSQMVCYCGSVVTLNHIDVVVTSENTEISLGSMTGTSMSGRIRQMAADLNIDGTVRKDNIFERIEAWKREHNSLGPFRLGLCIVSPPFGASARGFKAIIHAVTLEKRPDGVNRIDESAIREVIQFVLKYCVDNNYKTVFLPAFGIGSGRLDAATNVHKTVNPLVDELRKSPHPITVYLGTYRVKDAILVGFQASKLT